MKRGLHDTLRSATPPSSSEAKVFNVTIPSGIEQVVANRSALVRPSVNEMDISLRSREAIVLQHEAETLLDDEGMLSTMKGGGRLVVTKYPCPIKQPDGTVLHYAFIARYPKDATLGPLDRVQPQPYDNDIRIIYSKSPSPWQLQSDMPEGILRFEGRDDGGFDVLRTVDPDDHITPVVEQHTSNKRDDLAHVRHIIGSIQESVRLSKQSETEDDAKKGRIEKVVDFVKGIAEPLPVVAEKPEDDVQAQTPDSQPETSKEKAVAIIALPPIVIGGIALMINGLKNYEDQYIPPAPSNYDQPRYPYGDPARNPRDWNYPETNPTVIIQPDYPTESGPPSVGTTVIAPSTPSPSLIPTTTFEKPPKSPYNDPSINPDNEGPQVAPPTVTVSNSDRPPEAPQPIPIPTWDDLDE